MARVISYDQGHVKSFMSDEVLNERLQRKKQINKGKINFMLQNKIPLDYFHNFLYLRIVLPNNPMSEPKTGSKCLINEILIKRPDRWYVPMKSIKKAIINLFYPGCTKDIWFQDASIWEGKLVKVLAVRDYNGKWFQLSHSGPASGSYDISPIITENITDITEI